MVIRLKKANKKYWSEWEWWLAHEASETWANWFNLLGNTGVAAMPPTLTVPLAVQNTVPCIWNRPRRGGRRFPSWASASGSAMAATNRGTKRTILKAIGAKLDIATSVLAQLIQVILVLVAKLQTDLQSCCISLILIKMECSQWKNKKQKAILWSSVIPFAA